MNRTKNLARTALLLAALIWGSSYISQVVAMKYIGPFTFIFSRYLLGALSVALLSLVWDLIRQHRGSKTEAASGWNDAVIPGAVCGAVMFAAITLQQCGLKYTQAGKAGFITAMYIIIVPVLELMAGKRFGKKTWFATAIATIGLYLLSIKSGFTIEWGDFLVLSATIFWALYIICCDRFAQRRDPLKVSALQFAVTALMAAVCMFIFETPKLSAICTAYIPILHAGIVCTAVAYTLQMCSQRSVSPVETSFILSTECLFALAGGFLVLGETLSLKEFCGCLLLFTGVIIAQLPDKNVPNDL